MTDTTSSVEPQDDPSTFIHRKDWHPKVKLVDGYYQRLEGDEYRPEFYLDHQCDEWEIGGVEDAKRFVAYLQHLIDEVDDQQERKP